MNPMVAMAGHVAIIIPRFAQGRIPAEDIGVHVYQGAHRWISRFKSDVHGFFRVLEDQ
jgi:hypothetical protein